MSSCSSQVSSRQIKTALPTIGCDGGAYIIYRSGSSSPFGSFLLGKKKRKNPPTVFITLTRLNSEDISDASRQTCREGEEVWRRGRGERRKEIAWRVFVQSPQLPWEWSEAGWWGGLERVLPSFLKQKIKRLNDSIDPCRCLIFASFLLAPSCIRCGKSKKKLYRLFYTSVWIRILNLTLKFPTLFFWRGLIGEKFWAWKRCRPHWHFSKSLRLLWNSSMTPERPDTGLNSPFQVGRITSGFARRWSCPMNRSHRRRLLLPWSKFWLSRQLELSCYHQTVTRPHFPACTHSSQVYISPSQSSVYRILWLWRELGPHS